jgi:tetratricopeptide (TPR) repeat protein
MQTQAKRSLSHYQKALLIKPDSAVTYNQLGALYSAQGQYEESIHAYIKAIQADPNGFSSYWNLKYAVLKTHFDKQFIDPGLLEQGVSILRQASRHKPEFAFAHAVLGHLLTQLGRKEEAIACYETSSYLQTRISDPEIVERYWDKNLQRQPDFLIPGFIKCGTTSLYSYLSAHPQILPAIDKELFFFKTFQEQGLDWYLSQFPKVSSSSYQTGEATPIYLTQCNGGQRVFQDLPHVKLVILLRNPVDQIISSYYQNMGSGLRSENLVELMNSAIDKMEGMLGTSCDLLSLRSKNLIDDYKQDVAFMCLAWSLYLYHLQPWLSLFPKEQVLILKSEDLFSNPGGTVQKVYQFLNLPDYSLAKYPNANPSRYSTVLDPLRQRLISFSRPYVQQLEDYLETKFNWED